jgi:hypothetical protein
MVNGLDLLLGVACVYAGFVGFSAWWLLTLGVLEAALLYASPIVPGDRDAGYLAFVCFFTSALYAIPYGIGYLLS